MNIKCGLLDESVKYVCGNRFDEAWMKSEIGKEEWYYKNKSIKLMCAQNDFAAFQLILKSDEDFLLSTTEKTAFSYHGAIPDIRIEICLDKEYDLQSKISAIGLVEDDDRIRKADIILADEEVHVKKGEGQPVWIEIAIPKDFGTDYICGKVNLYAHTLFTDEVKVAALDFSVDVWDFNLPDPKEYKFYLNLWQHLSNIARKHEVKLWSDDHFKVIESYVKSLADLGQKVITLVVSEIPWSGQRCFAVGNYPSNLYEYNIIKVEKDINGQYIYDFSVLDRYVELCFTYCIDKEIELIGLLNIWYFPDDGFGKLAEDYPDAIRIRYYDKNERKYKFICDGEEIKSYICSLERHLIEKGWIDIVRVLADEPHDEQRFLKSLSVLKETAPRFKYKAAISHPSFIKEFENLIDDYAAYFGCLIEDMNTYKDMKSAGRGRYLWYTACGGFPDSCLRAPLLETRFIGLLTAYLGLEGFLRWNYTAWPEKPKEMLCWNYPAWPAGETNFVYPGNMGGPIYSLRYKSLLRGIQDFELVRILREEHPDAEGILNKLLKMVVISDMESINNNTQSNKLLSLNYEDYTTVKRILVKEIRALASSKKGDEVKPMEKK